VKHEILADGIEIYCADCMDVMRDMPDKSVDAVITDPPYDNKTHKGAIINEEIGFNPLSDIDLIVGEFIRLSSRWILSFCSIEMIGDYSKASGDCWIRAGVWDRVINMPQMSGDRPSQAVEGIAIIHDVGLKKWNGGGKSAIWRYAVERGNKRHPTQKPIRLMKHLIGQFTDEGDTVLDPFMGSGTTGVACVQTGRKFIGIEIDTDYYEIAKRRIKEALMQPRLL